MGNEQFMLSSDQFAILKITYIDAQVNYLAVTQVENLFDMYVGGKYYVKDAKMLWKRLWKMVTAYKEQVKKYVNYYMLVDYCWSVEEFVSNDINELKRAFLKEISEQGKPTDDDAVLLAQIQLTLSLMEYSIRSWKRMERYKDGYVSPYVDDHVLRKYRFDQFNLSEMYKLFSRFVDEAYKMIPCGDVNLHDSKLVNANIKSFDDVMLSKRVTQELLDDALEVDERETDDKERVVKLGVPFNVGRGRFKSVLLTDMAKIKCNECVFKGRAACGMYNCDGVYFERVG